MYSPEMHAHSEFFALRFWSEELGEGQEEWRGKLQHVLSGETHYFRSWQTLVDELEEMLPRLEAEKRRLVDLSSEMAGEEENG